MLETSDEYFLLIFITERAFVPEDLQQKTDSVGASRKSSQGLIEVNCVCSTQESAACLVELTCCTTFTQLVNTMQARVHMNQLETQPATHVIVEHDIQEVVISILLRPFQR